MRLCTFEVRTVLGTFQRLGVQTPGGIVDLCAASAWHLHTKGEPQPYRIAAALVGTDMLSFLQIGPTAMTLARTTVEHLLAQAGAALPTGLNGETLLFAPGDVRLRAPLMRPSSMRDFYAFEQHVRKGFEKRGEEMPPEWFEMPVYYKGAHWSIIGTDDDVSWPSFTEKFDYELELAVIIGKAGRNIPESKAREHIAGFTVMNDFSARDIQRKEMKVRLGPAKGKDFATAIGPVLVTPDEIGDPYTLRMTARVNGELWSEGNSGSITHSFERMIAFAAGLSGLMPMATPSGTQMRLAIAISTVTRSRVARPSTSCGRARNSCAMRRATSRLASSALGRRMTST